MPRGCAVWAWKGDADFPAVWVLPQPHHWRSATDIPCPVAFPSLAEAQGGPCWLCPQDTWVIWIRAGQGGEGQVNENKTTPEARQLLPSASRPRCLPHLPLPCRLQAGPRAEAQALHFESVHQALQRLVGGQDPVVKALLVFMGAHTLAVRSLGLLLT